MTKDKEYQFIDRAFNIALLWKAVFAVIETLSGIVMMFVTPTVMDNFFDWLQHKHIISGLGFLGTLLLHWQTHFSANGQWLAVVYLMSHGLIKLTLIYFLYKRVEKAYPVSIVVLVLFIIYQLYEFIFRHSLLLLGATLVDMIVIYLTVLEYRRMKGKW